MHSEPQAQPEECHPICQAQVQNFAKLHVSFCECLRDQKLRQGQHSRLLHHLQTSGNAGTAACKWQKGKFEERMLYLTKLLGSGV